MSDTPRVVIAMGDPAGISPELLAKLLSQKELLDLATVTVIGDRRVLALGERAAGVSLDIATVGAGVEAARPGRPVFVDLKHLDPATIPMAQATAEGGRFAIYTRLHHAVMDGVSAMRLMQTSLTTDPDLAGIKQIYGLADELKGIPSDRLAFLTVPNYPREADVPTDKANVVWQYPQAADLFTSLAKDKEVTKAQLDASKRNVVYASSVRVQVLNGTGVSGRAAAVAERLRKAGYTVTGTGNAPGGTVARTTLTYPSGLDGKAAVLASRLPGLRPTADGSAAGAGGAAGAPLPGRGVGGRVMSDIAGFSISIELPHLAHLVLALCRSPNLLSSNL